MSGYRFLYGEAGLNMSARSNTPHRHAVAILSRLVFRTWDFDAPADAIFDHDDGLSSIIRTHRDRSHRVLPESALQAPTRRTVDK